MSYNALAKEIIEKVGGASNITSLTHCMTRLRFNLKNSSKADLEVIKEIDGVVGAVNKGGQFQIIIGTHVSKVYEAIQALGVIGESITDEPTKNKGIIPAVLDTIAGSFTPIIPAIAGTGMLKALLALLTTFGWLATDSQNYYILNFVSDAAFYFLPFFLAFSAANKFKMNPYVAAVLAGILLHPDLTVLSTLGESVNYLGLPLTLVTYSSSVIPILLIVWIGSYVEKYMKKISPKAIEIFFVPMMTILIMSFLCSNDDYFNYVDNWISWSWSIRNSNRKCLSSNVCLFK